MENIKLPAYPLPIARHQNGTLNTTLDVDTASVGFTKLELASLMIAQGLTNRPEYYKTEEIASFSVSIAEAVLQEANK